MLTIPESPVLYITGHSLGGALAVLAAALIDWDDELNKMFPDMLRGIHTYGQPMVGDATFAREHADGIGKYPFRHVYERDIVPRLEPWADSSISAEIAARPMRAGRYESSRHRGHCPSA